MKKLLIVFMAAVMLLALIACDSTPAGESTVSTPAAESEDTSEGEKVYAANVPEGTDLQGADIVILTTATDPNNINGGEFGWGKDEAEATVVNEAIWNRNNRVGELLHCNIVERCVADGNRMANGAMLSTIKTGVDGNTADYSIVAPSLYQAGYLAPGNYLYNLLNLENMNGVSDEWWDSYFVDAVEIKGKVFFAIGDIGYQSRQSITPVFFNKEIAAQIEIENPYDLVRNKKWTIDVITAWSKLFSSDMNGDGIDYLDKYGMGGQNDNIWAMFFGAGETVAAKDATGTPVITIYNERSTGVAEKIKTLMNDKSCFINANELFGISNTPVDLLTEAFSEGRSLLFCDALLNVENLRDMSFDFGILPCPLYDENQTEYYSMVNPWTSNAFGIPSNLDSTDAENAALVMECLGAEGKNLLTPAYIEIALKGQKTRDDESQEMLDIIFGSVGCDIGHIYNWGSLGSAVLHATAEGGEFTSLCDANIGAAEAAIATTIEAFDAID